MTKYYTDERATYVRGARDKYAHYGKNHRDKVKAEMVAAYGGCCVVCGIDNPDVLCLDHVNGDSHVEREHFRSTSRGGDRLYAKLKKEGWPQGRFQLLCYNCNAVKEHQRRRAAINEKWGIQQFANRVLIQARIGKQRNNRSGIKGVFWDSQKGRWSARIMVDYKNRYLGFYENIGDAARAYRTAAIREWGADANVPTDAEIEAVASRWREVEMPKPKR